MRLFVLSILDLRLSRMFRFLKFLVTTVDGKICTVVRMMQTFIFVLKHIVLRSLKRFRSGASAQLAMTVKMRHGMFTARRINGPQRRNDQGNPRCYKRSCNTHCALAAVLLLDRGLTS